MTVENMIDRLRNSEIMERPQILQQQYEKNRVFLQKRFPEVGRLLKSVKCPYRIDLTESFLNIVHEPTETIAHPEVGLDLFAEVLGDWVHDTWHDLFNFKVVAPEQYPMHQAPIKNMHRQLMINFPEYPIAFAQRKINLKQLEDGRRFSPPVIFLGIFHGLHIDYFLNRTELDTILLVEPEPERFEVSCYFLDYSAIYERFDRVMISIGDDVDAKPIRDFFSSYHVTPQMWSRVLPAYFSEKNPFFIESFKMHQTTLVSVIYPIEYEILGLQHAVKNIVDKLPLFTRLPKLSRKSRIAVVATGPSLDNDLLWLKKNKKNIIIFAVASAVSSLKAHGIEPDIQFTLEAHLPTSGLVTLEMSNAIPTLAFVNANEDTVNYLRDNIFLCGNYDKASPVQLTRSVPFMGPSTTNFTIAFACMCQPKEILMLGCDFGYFSIDHHHSASSIYKDMADKSKGIISQVEEMKQVMMAANFGAEGGIQSNPFLTQTRLIVERCIEAYGQKINIFNLSDGAKVSGAKPKRSARIRLGFYKEKKKDIRKLLQAFSPAEEGVNYKTYPISGSDVLEKLKGMIIEKMQLRKFEWKEFSKAIDSVVYDSVKACQDTENDLRMDIYSRLFIDLLSTWYSTIIFFDDVNRAEEVYEKGLELFTNAINDLVWAEEMIGKDDLYPLLKASFKQSS